MSKQIYFFGKDYKKLIQGVIVLSVFCVIAQIMMKLLLINNVLPYNENINIYWLLMTIVLIVQIFCTIMFPVNYCYLIKNGYYEHKLSKVLIPEAVIACLLVIVIFIMTI